MNSLVPNTSKTRRTLVIIVGGSFGGGSVLGGPRWVETSVILPVDVPRDDVAVSPHRGDSGEKEGEDGEGCLRSCEGASLPMRKKTLEGTHAGNHSGSVCTC